MRALLPALLLAAAAAFPARAQVHTLRGVVRDTASRPLAGAEVLLPRGRQKAVTDAAGRFRLDSLPGGEVTLLVRLVGYAPSRPTVTLPRPEGEEHEILLFPLPQLLPTIVVESERPGIRGVVGDAGYRAIAGAQVALLRQHDSVRTDDRGRFAFEGLRPGAYMLQVSHPEYRSRLISVQVAKGTGREYSIFLEPRGARGDDWTELTAYRVALRDLDARMAWETDRRRLTREQLARYGTMDLCDIPLLRSEFPRSPPRILTDGHQRQPPETSLCLWQADELELVEWGPSICGESARTIATQLGVICGVRSTSSIRGGIRAGSGRGGWMVLWYRR